MRDELKFFYNFFCKTFFGLPVNCQKSGEWGRVIAFFFVNWKSKKKTSRARHLFRTLWDFRPFEARPMAIVNQTTILVLLAVIVIDMTDFDELSFSSLIVKGDIVWSQSN